MTNVRSVLVGLAVLAAVPVATSASPVVTAAAPISAHQEPFLGNLLVGGDRVEVEYKLDTSGVKSPTGALYVRPAAAMRIA